MAYTPKTEKERILHRLKIAAGHLKKVQEMVENDQYCIDVIHQSQAVQQALKNMDGLILENHLRECVPHAIHSGKTEEAIAEVMQVIKRSGK